MLALVGSRGRSMSSSGAASGYRTRSRSLFLSIIPVVWLGIAGPIIAASLQPEAHPAGVLGFAATVFTYAPGPENSDACPTGLATSAAALYLQTLPPAERAEMSKAENVQKLYTIAARTKDGKEICMDPTIVPDSGLATVQGGWASGVNLDDTSDGHKTAMTCSHEKFTAPDGQPGVDNQFYRVVGCALAYQSKGILASAKAAALRQGEFSILFEIKGAKDRLNASDVEVGIYSGTTPTAFSNSGTPLPNASISVSRNAYFRTVTHGQIVNGVLTTASADVHLGVSQDQGADYTLKSARLRLELQSDGGAKGVLGGYQDLGQLFKNQFQYKGRGGIASSAFGYSCQGVYYALHRLADGYPDPQTGQCTAISSVFKIEAIPAFVVHMDDEAPAGRQASADDSKTARP
jgi:hypothetical protein